MELSQDNVLDRQSQRLPTFQSKIEKFYKCQSKYSTNKILHLKETKILLQLFSLQKYAVFMFMTPRGLLNLILGNICDHLKCIQIQWSAASSVVSQSQDYWAGDIEVHQITTICTKFSIFIIKTKKCILFTAIFLLEANGINIDGKYKY